MRMMVLNLLFPSKRNQAFKDGSLGKTLGSIMKKLNRRPLTSGPSDGKRSGMIFLILLSHHQGVDIVEPLFSKLNAAVEIVPVMDGDDQRKGIARATEK